MSTFDLLSCSRLKRWAALLPACLGLLVFPACGGNGLAPVVTSNLQNRAFISNMYSGALQIVDTQDDMTAYTQQTYNSSGQLVQGQPFYITILQSAPITWEVESPDRMTTAVFDPAANAIYFVTNSDETESGDVALTTAAPMALYSPDSSTMYAPEPNRPVAGQRNGAVEVVTVSSTSVTATYPVPSASGIALSPDGNTLLVFAQNSDSLYLINLSASSPSPVAIPGFARPINAFFSSDGTTAYVLNCGPECGSSGAASVSAFNIGSQTITATVPVGGASVGLLNGTTLYVAGSPVPPGTTSTFDAVNVSNMTRITTNSVAIGDGFHTTMALATNNKLYIGASSCSNTTTGCLSVVNVQNYTADAPLPPRGAITSLLAVANRNVMYTIEGGYLHIYDTDNDQLQQQQLIFTGALYGIVQVDQ